ncbi:hypothetical protein TNCV_3885781 [Trichonephila clavipes]|nr:hypothetical protein TNCV_3885781 [Trichonephila clavipes]
MHWMTQKTAPCGKTVMSAPTRKLAASLEVTNHFRNMMMMSSSFGELDGLIPGTVIAFQNTNPPPVLEGSSGPSNRRLEEEAMGRGRRRLLPNGDLLSPREHKSYFGAIDPHFGSRRTIFFVRYIASR